MGAKKIINFWSMWSTQPLNQQFVNTVAADYMEAHPDVQINVSYWEKAALDQALQAALTAGRRARHRGRHELPVVCKSRLAAES